MTLDMRRVDRVDDFFAQHQALLARQGAVVASWRVRDGRRLGPYFRLETRLPRGHRVSVYLGSGADLVAAARNRLAELQRPVHAQRQLAIVYRHLRRGARAVRVTVAEELSKIGLRLKGSEIRGMGHGTLAHLLKATLADPGAAKTEKMALAMYVDRHLDLQSLALPRPRAEVGPLRSPDLEQQQYFHKSLEHLLKVTAP